MAICDDHNQANQEDISHKHFPFILWISNQREIIEDF